MLKRAHQRINVTSDKAIKRSAVPLDTFSPWRSAGPVLFSPGRRPMMPEGIPPKAGVYHITYNDRTHYFGEAFNLRRRLMEHCEAPTSDGDRQRRNRIMRTEGATICIALQIGVTQAFAPGEKALMEQIYPGAAAARQAKERQEATAQQQREPTEKVWRGRQHVE